MPASSSYFQTSSAVTLANVSGSNIAIQLMHCTMYHRASHGCMIMMHTELPGA